MSKRNVENGEHVARGADMFTVVRSDIRVQAGKLTDVTAIGFDTRSVGGHDEAALDTALAQAKSAADGRPKAIVARTVKGKGVSFMENQNAWHYTRLNEETYRAALREVEAG